MRTHEYVIERERLAEQVVHPIHLAPILIAARQSRLVGRSNQQQSRSLQFRQKWNCRGVDVHFLERHGADLMLPFNAHHVQDTIPLNKYTQFHTSPIQHKSRLKPRCAEKSEFLWKTVPFICDSSQK